MDAKEVAAEIYSFEWLRKWYHAFGCDKAKTRKVIHELIELFVKDLIRFRMFERVSERMLSRMLKRMADEKIEKL